MRLNIEHLAEILRAEQQGLLQDVSNIPIEQAAAIASLFRGGARARWGLDGWFLEDSGVSIPSSVIADLERFGLIEGDEGAVVWTGLKRPARTIPQDLVEDLLCDRWARDLDRVSRVMLRYQQELALLARISELRRLHEQADALEIDYRLLSKRRWKWWFALTGLYLAGFFNLLGWGPDYRRRLARRSLSTIEQLIPGSLHQF